jgi:hypothetical protein
MGVTGPVSATGSGGKFAFPGDNRQWPDTFEGTCQYPAGPVAENGFLLTYTCRLGAADAVPSRRHGKTFHGDKATLILDRGGFEIIPQEREGKRVAVEKRVTSAKTEHEVVQDHVRGFLKCLRSRRRPEADIEVGHRATNPGHLMNIAWRVGRTIRWDTADERIIDDPSANALTAKEYRQPWNLPA